VSNIVDGVVFSFTALKDFDDPKYAEDVLRVVAAAPAKLRPTKYGAFQAELPIDGLGPLVEMLGNRAAGPGYGSAGSLVLAAKGCQYQLQWNRIPGLPSFPFVSGQVLGPDDGDRLAALMTLAKDLVPVLNPIYGDIRSMRVAGWDTPFDLKVRLPDIPNISIYGPPYIELFGRERIESAPFQSIERLGKSHYWLEAAPLTEVVNDDAKRRIREHLGADAFMAGRQWRYKSGHAPQFDRSPTTGATH
jgi:hypothetical protein